MFDLPDYRLDPPAERQHSDECGCFECHDLRDHDWRDWNIYPPCESCEAEMLEFWADELQEAA